MKKNDIIELEMTGMTHEGLGVGRKNGMAVFVEGAVSGEKVNARIIKVQKNYAVAEVQKWLKAIPKFESENSIEMNDILKAMGMTDAFDYTVSDFSGIGSSIDGNLYISRVLHKTFIAVDEKGTKAGAATVVEMKDESSMIEPEEIKTVYLDRPFLYMLIDCEANLPVLIGTVMDITN
jgi:serine protease inhibitor